MTTAAVLLAAGASRRFGPTDKLRFQINGRPMLTITAGNLLGCGADHLIAVLRDPDLAALLPPQFQTVICQGEQSDSLRAGLAAARKCGATRLLVALADMPFVQPDQYVRVIACCDGAVPSASAGPDGQAMPPACFPQTSFNRIEALTGDRGAGALLRDGCVIVSTSQDYLHDIDTPPDVPG